VVPLLRAVLVLKTLPPVLVEYHLMLVPVAVRFATVPLLQKVWEALPVGAAGTAFTVRVAVVELEPPEFVAVN
jgi:hypothetical protein